MTMTIDAAGDRPEHLREELLFALEREGIDYPPERLAEALAEYAQLKRLIGVIAADRRATDTAAAGVTSDRPSRFRLGGL